MSVNWLLILMAGGGLLLGSADTCASRDPFTPPDSLNCQAAGHARPLWRLRGIIGHKEDYRALMVSDQGKGRLRGHKERLDEYWQLREVDARSVTLAAQQGCTPPLRLALKGSIYENSALENDVAVAAVTPAVAPRQPTTALTGVR